MKTTRIFVGSLCALLLFACGGGGGGGGSTVSPPPPPNPPPVADQAIGGIYTGTIDGCGPPTCPIDAFVLISEDGEWLSQDLAFSSRPATVSITVNGSAISGDRNLYGVNPGLLPFGHAPTRPATAEPDNENRGIQGIVNERQNIQGSFVHNGGATASVSLTYDQASYEIASSLQAIAGTYSADDGAGLTLTYVIDTMGVVTGSDSTGCTVNGSVSIIDANYNIYRTDLSFGNCGANGADGAGYTGVATLRTDPNTMQESLFFSAATDDEIVVMDLPRI